MIAAIDLTPGKIDEGQGAVQVFGPVTRGFAIPVNKPGCRTRMVHAAGERDDGVAKLTEVARQDLAKKAASASNDDPTGFGVGHGISKKAQLR